MGTIRNSLLLSSLRGATLRLRTWLVAAPLFIGSFASACESTTGTNDARRSIEYSIEVLETLEKDHDWARGPVVYLRASLFAVNVTDDSATVSMPSCILGLEALFSSQGGTLEAPSWRSVDRLGWPGSVLIGCRGGINAELGPGDTLRGLTTEIPLAQILADSLPAGPYHFQVRIMSEVEIGSSSRTEDLLVALGDIHLPVSQHPLSLGAYRRDGFEYRMSASSSATVGSSARATLEMTHTAPSSGILERVLSENCPIRLFAFRNAEERETIPVPEALWTWPDPSSCGTTTVRVRLGSDESETFETEVPSQVVDAGGEGIEDLFLLAIIDVDGRPIRFGVDPS